MAKSSTLTLTLTILMLCSHIISMQTSALDVTLSSPRTTIKAQIGEELHITCLASKCSNKNPGFTWANLMDLTVDGSVNTVGQTSTLTMMVKGETEGTYRCSVSCDNPPVQKGFKIAVYSFPSDPILQISSLVAGRQSQITCMVPNIFPYVMLSVEIQLDEKTVATFDYADHYMTSSEIQNVSLTHDLTLRHNMYGKEIKCVAVLEFPGVDTEPIRRHSAQNLTLIFTPIAPTVNVLPSTTARAGENIYLLCSSDFLSQAVEQWVRLIGDEEIEMPTDVDGTLAISDAQPEDSGVYICYAKNSAGKTSSQVEINVQGLPEKPILLLQPGTTVVAGQAVIIECLVSNNTNVTLWKMSEDGDLYYLDSEVKAMIEYADPTDAAVYKCVAENQYGASEASETLTVEYPPRETILTSSSTDVNEGDTVTLTCVSKGVPTPSISIYKLSTSGESVLLSEDSVITVSNVTSGIYQCQANNRLGIERHKLEVMVRVPPKNTIIALMPSHTVREGDNVLIRCASDSFPAPKLVLRLKTELGITDLEHKHGLYNISHATERHTGTYICESSNVIGQQIVEATLTVQVAPRNTQVVIFPSPVVGEGDHVQIWCSSEGSPGPRLTLKRRRGDETISLDLTHGSYNITHVVTPDAGTYICESTNVVGQDVAEETLDVYFAPRNTYIVLFPSPVAAERDSVHIQCFSEGSPDPKLTLKRRRGEETISLDLTDGSYNITHVGSEDEGTYICEATNVVGQDFAEDTLIVHVVSKNTHIDILPSPVVIEGDSVQIWCSSEGFLYSILKRRIGDEIISLESTDGFYNITRVGTEDAGTYICEFTNVEGQEVAEDTLTVQIPPRNTTVVVTPSQNIKEGDTVTITCETHSIPSPTIILQKVCAENNTVLQTDNGTFTLHNVTRNDTGTYTLKIFNSAGNETEVINISVAERQQSLSFNPTSTFIFGSVAFVSAGVIGSIIYHLKKSKLQGSYSLVKALRGKV